MAALNFRTTFSSILAACVVSSAGSAVAAANSLSVYLDQPETVSRSSESDGGRWCTGIWPAQGAIRYDFERRTLLSWRLVDSSGAKGRVSHVWVSGAGSLVVDKRVRLRGSQMPSHLDGASLGSYSVFVHTGWVRLEAWTEQAPRVTKTITRNLTMRCAYSND